MKYQFEVEEEIDVCGNCPLEVELIIDCDSHCAITQRKITDHEYFEMKPKDCPLTLAKEKEE